MTDQLSRIEQKLDKLLNILGGGAGKLPSEIRREASATVLQWKEKRGKKSDVSTDKDPG